MVVGLFGHLAFGFSRKHFNRIFIFFGYFYYHFERQPLVDVHYAEIHELFDYVYTLQLEKVAYFLYGKRAFYGNHFRFVYGRRNYGFRLFFFGRLSFFEIFYFGGFYLRLDFRLLLRRLLLRLNGPFGRRFFMRRRRRMLLLRSLLNGRLRTFYLRLNMLLRLYGLRFFLLGLPCRFDRLYRRLYRFRLNFGGFNFYGLDPSFFTSTGFTASFFTSAAPPCSFFK